MATDDQVELRSIHDEAPSLGSALPPADHGKQANLVLLGCSMLQLPIWGFSTSYGVFQEYYTHSSDLQGELSVTGIVGTTLNGIVYLSMPFLFGLFTSRGVHLRQHAGIAGIAISTASLLLSSFSQLAWQLVVTQGVLHAIGTTLLFSSTTIYVDEWFIQRKGFAYGVMLSVKSAVGGGLPLLFGVMLSRLGFRTTLRIWAGFVLVSAAPAISLLRRRVSTTREPPRARRLSWKFLHHPTFYVFQLANIVFSASYGIPMTYLSTFATSSFHFSTSRSALMVAALNAPSTIASFWFGLLSDGKGLGRGVRPLSISTVSCISAMGACLPVFLLWGLSSADSGSGVALMSLFAVLYGFFAGGYSAIWGGIVKEMQREAERRNEPVDTALIFGLLNGGRGLGYVAGGFAGVELLKAGAVASSHWAYGTEYGSLILFTGLGFAFSGCTVLFKCGRIAQR